MYLCNLGSMEASLVKMGFPGGKPSSNDGAPDSAADHAPAYCLW